MTRETWSVWRAFVRFDEDDSKGKSRPVVVLHEMRDSITSVKVTSNLNREGYRLIRWREAGLWKPSVVQADRGYILLSDSEMGGRLGHLDGIDITGLYDYISAHKHCMLMLDTPFTGS